MPKPERTREKKKLEKHQCVAEKAILGKLFILFMNNFIIIKDFAKLFIYEIAPRR